MDRTGSVHLVYLSTTYQDEMLRITSRTTYVIQMPWDAIEWYEGDKIAHIYDAALHWDMNEFLTV
jgi:hypothetical protein